MQRRRLLQLGLATGTLVTLAGGGLAWWRPGWSDGRLTPAGREVLAAVSRIVLLPLIAPAALPAQLVRIEDAVRAFPPHTQAELSQLLALLATPPTRVALTGLETDWTLATDAELDAMLQRLRGSRVALRRQVYHALRDLCTAAWFADPAAWQALGYPGPRKLAA